MVLCFASKSTISVEFEGPHFETAKLYGLDLINHINQTYSNQQSFGWFHILCQRNQLQVLHFDADQGAAGPPARSISREFGHGSTYICLANYYILYLYVYKLYHSKT